MSPALTASRVADRGVPSRRSAGVETSTSPILERRDDRSYASAASIAEADGVGVLGEREGQFGDQVASRPLEHAFLSRRQRLVDVAPAEVPHHLRQLVDVAGPEHVGVVLDRRDQLAGMRSFRRRRTSRTSSNSSGLMIWRSPAAAACSEGTRRVRSPSANRSTPGTHRTRRTPGVSGCPR